MTLTLPYKSRVNMKILLKLSENSVFKVYFLDILNRDNREKYEWKYSINSPNKFLDKIKELNPVGIGFIIVFPHIFKIFRFGFETETNLYYKSFNTLTMEEINLRKDSWIEMSCLGEIAIANEEFNFWAQKATVESYLELFSKSSEEEIKNHTKLNQYLKELKS